MSLFSWLKDESTDAAPPSLEMAGTNIASAQNPVAKGHHTALLKYKRTGNIGAPFREEEDKVRMNT